MPGKEEDLRNAKAEPDPDINFTYNELLDGLKTEYRLEERLPGDVSCYDMAEATGLERRWCAEVLKKKAQKGELLQIRTRNSNGRMIFVYRKVKQ